MNFVTAFSTCLSHVSKLSTSLQEVASRAFAPINISDPQSSNQVVAEGISEEWIPVETPDTTLATQIKWLNEQISKGNQNLGIHLLEFNSIVARYVDLFHIKIFNSLKHHGYITKKDLDVQTEIYVRADLHGSVRCLLHNLQELQAAGLLDEKYRCKPNTLFVFLGDYVDRGADSLLVLQVLMTLKIENPDQVILIRGNHEYLSMNSMTSDIVKFVEKDFSSKMLLQRAYESMPLTAYVCQKSNTDKREYVHFTHGLAELHIDPTQLLTSPFGNSLYIIPKTVTLSQRVQNLNMHVEDSRFIKDKSKLKLYKAANRITALIHKSFPYRKMHPHLTAYNWGDIGHQTLVESLSDRQWRLSTEDLKNYLDLYSETHKIATIIRGHQHHHISHIYKNRLIALTLPIAPHLIYSANPQDIFYVFKTEEKVENWTKRCFCHEGSTTTITTHSFHEKIG